MHSKMESLANGSTTFIPICSASICNCHKFLAPLVCSSKIEYGKIYPSYKAGDCVDVTMLGFTIHLR